MAILKFIRINKWIPKIRANRCQLCTKSDNEEARVKRGRLISKHSSEVDAFFQSNNHMEYLKELIPANIKLKRKTVIPDRMYLICPNTAKKVAKYVWKQTKSNRNQLICETNPGVGVITKELLEKGARKVRLYEPNELFHEPLKVLLQKYLHRIEIVDKDLMDLGTYVYLDKKAPADRVEQLLEGIPKKSWTDDPVMTVVGVMPKNYFIKDLVKSIVSQRNIATLGRTDFYLFVFPTVWIKLTEEDDVNFHLKFWVILYNIFFDFQLIDKFDKELFMPWISQTKKNKQNMVMCFVPTCKHYSEQGKCKFFYFPKDPIVFRKWILMVRRQDREPGKYSRICSCHFVNGDKENLPTILSYNLGISFDFSEGESMCKRAKKEENMPQPSTSGLQSQLRNSSATACEEDSLQNQSRRSSTSTCEEESSDESVEMFGPSKELEEVSASVEKLESLSFVHIKDNEKILMTYTGIPTKDIFLSLFKLFENLELTYFHQRQVVNMPKIDQLLLTLMKLKLNLLNEDLGFRFRVSRATVSNIFKTWLFALHEVLVEQLMANIPSSEKNKMCMPTSSSPFTNCRIIIDCTEINTVQPGRMDPQKSTYSSDKHRNTLKALVGVAPNGVVTFVSKLYPGSTSDEQITQHCGILDKLEAGDLILAYKGLLIHDILPEGVSLNIPPFLVTPHFTPEQVLRMQTIARARIHVERAIRRIKSFLILKVIPPNLIPYSSEVFQVCAALTNLQFPLIGEV